MVSSISSVVAKPLRSASRMPPMKRFVPPFLNEETKASVPAKGRFCAKSSENRTMSATNTWQPALGFCPPKLGRQTRALRVDAADLRAFESQIVHQALLIEDEADHRTHDLVGVDGAADTDGDDGHRAVDADLPPRPLFEPGQCVLGHEHDDDGPLLYAKLKAEGGRY